MNTYSKLYKLIKGFSNILFTSIGIYSAYVLCTPGLYHLLVIYLCIIVTIITVAIKYKKSLKLKLQSYPDEELHIKRYYNTHRKRYYNKFYIASMILMFIVSMSMTGIIIYERATYAMNDKYIEAIGKVDSLMLETADMDLEGSFNALVKTIPVMPNASKESFILGVEILEMVVDLQELMLEYKDTNQLDEAKLVEYKTYVEEKQNQVDTVSNDMLKEVVLSGFSFILLFHTLDELKSFLRHRSLVTKEMYYHV